MIRMLQGIVSVLLAIATGCGIALTGLVALAAIMRYVFHAPFAFTEELVGLLFSALVFLALPYVTLNRKHIHVTLLSDLLPAQVRRVTGLLGDLLVVVFCIWFGTYAWQFAEFSFELGARTDLAGITLWPWMGFMVLACGLMGVCSLCLLRRHRGR